MPLSADKCHRRLLLVESRKILQVIGVKIDRKAKNFVDVRNQERKKHSEHRMSDEMEMIRNAGYPAEAHVVLTEDGYFLTIHRIPGGKNSPLVFLQHGLLCSSADWVVIGKNKALPFKLADQGYDVWLGNFRGNTYSRAHISLSPSDPKFWDFSFDEMGTYDLPAMLSYITNLTSEPLLTYIGYSMGTTSFYVMAIKRPEIANMVKVMISLAPVVFLGNTTNPLRLFIPFSSDEYLMKLECDGDLFQKQICRNIVLLISGFSTEHINYTLLPKILTHFPSSTSFNAVAHFVQEIKSGKFRAYDYGREKNIQIYNATVPPDYDLSRITTPIALIHSDSDSFVNEKDLKILRGLLTNIVEDYRVPFPKFNHVDFLYAKNAPTLVYKKVLEIMKKEVNY
nr:PREDICTED: lipase 3-like isoform X1 [Linepithema humile]